MVDRDARIQDCDHDRIGRDDERLLLGIDACEHPLVRIDVLAHTGRHVDQIAMDARPRHVLDARLDLRGRGGRPLERHRHRPASGRSAASTRGRVGWGRRIALALSAVLTASGAVPAGV
jgi:hypothetical protein